MIKNFTIYGSVEIKNANINHLLYFNSIVYDYQWSGKITINENIITIVTEKGSSNISTNYFDILTLSGLI